MFAARISTSPNRLDHQSRPEPRALANSLQRPFASNSDRERRQERSAERGHVDLPSPLASHTIIPPTRSGSQLLQAKLRIGAVNDPLEMEADHVAEKVMRMSLPASPPSVSTATSRPLQRKCAECSEEEQESNSSAPANVNRKCAHCEAEEETLQTKRGNSSGNADASALVNEVLRSPGHPLAETDLAFFTPRFGFDFSHVRVHSDHAADDSARSVNALAYASGSNIAFATGQYRPGTDSGRLLIAHELAHVVQQTAAGKTLTAGAAPAPRTARAGGVSRNPVTSSAVQMKAEPGTIQRHKDDIVAYEGGQSSTMRVIQEGKLIYTAPAVSGHPGHGSNEVNVGPIPPGNYTIHPQITRPTVAKLEGGVCGANEISSGYQELTSTDKSPCDRNQHHYCNVACPTPADADQMCFTPVDCWGPMRIKIEGSQAVKSPTGATVIRNGFYIHGGNHADAVSSGCAKTLDNGIFANIRKLTGVKGAVPFCVGAACPKTVQSAVLVDELSGLASGAADYLAHSLSEVIP